MTHNLLKTKGQNMNFKQFQAECISMFGSQIKAPKMKAATNNIRSSGALTPRKRTVAEIKRLKPRQSLLRNKSGR